MRVIFLPSEYPLQFRIVILEALRPVLLVPLAPFGAARAGADAGRVPVDPLPRRRPPEALVALLADGGGARWFRQGPIPRGFEPVPGMPDGEGRGRTSEIFKSSLWIRARRWTLQKLHFKRFPYLFDPFPHCDFVNLDNFLPVRDISLLDYPLVRFLVTVARGSRFFPSRTRSLLHYRSSIFPIFTGGGGQLRKAC